MCTNIIEMCMDTGEIYIVTKFTCMNICIYNLIMHVHFGGIFLDVIVNMFLGTYKLNCECNPAYTNLTVCINDLIVIILPQIHVQKQPMGT